MPRFTVDPVVIEPSEYLEACLPRDVDKLIQILKSDFEDELEDGVHPSPDKFLNQCSSGELYETHTLLHDDYGIDADDDEPRSEGQRQFNNHLMCLKQNWLSVTKEDADIISIIGKKYGAL